MKKHVTIPFFIPHQGCPHKCVFCNQFTITGQSAIPRIPDIREKIILHRSTSRRNTEFEAAFFGGSFTGLPFDEQEAYLSAAHECVNEGLIDSIRVSTRPDYIDARRCRLLRQYGVKTVELGAQSFADNVLAQSKRGHTADDTKHASELLVNEGFDLVIQLMIGLPGDTAATMRHSAETAASLFPRAVRIYPAVVIAGTELEILFRSGKYAPLSLDEAIEICASMTSFFSERRIGILRTGIHTVDLPAQSSIIAGPYHPAFGFLVKSRMRRNELENIASVIPLSQHNGRIRMKLPRAGAEEYIGHRRENIQWLRSRFFPRELDYSISEDLKCPTISLKE